MRCTFCATGKGGFARNLRMHEIVDQVLTVQEHFGSRVSNVGALTPASLWSDQQLLCQGQHKLANSPQIAEGILPRT
jgi:hypothetical protein